MRHMPQHYHRYKSTKIILPTQAVVYKFHRHHDTTHNTLRHTTQYIKPHHAIHHDTPRNTSRHATQYITTRNAIHQATTSDAPLRDTATATTSKSDGATTHAPKTRQESHLIVTLLPYHHTVVHACLHRLSIRDLLTLDSSYAGKHLTLDSLEHCAATSRYVAHLVSKAELVDSGHRVATAYQ